ncbi:succinyldiaminopimelate transaminase [Streptomyces sp. PTM05]|uniref:Succinyldiaminopimelate transaminase n=1 Tax=Streptantibioticus parmotrematis TaxID=2873249 RepID=A0ABS7QN97_9ACTN|nr:succinyldiaminopimelate transaminase [Streptantibioticus parmotrematis]MBY8884164.1 succinyldiaminopimelate transaminase [Streptantibioticus parmotrematis]
MARVSDRLPVFPWDRLEPYKAAAAAHPDGVVDLSVGTPVDPVPAVVRRALTEAADSPGYPLTYGTAALREAIAAWFTRRLSAAVAPADVLPLIGSKELVGLLPLLLDLREGDQVAYPALAYPTYEIGALTARAEPVTYDDPVTDLDPSRVRLLWLNTPSNPTGRTLGAAELRRIVEWAREHGVLVVSDECYVELGWETEPVSVLHPEVCGAGHQGLIAVHSLSKRSNFAGYRGAFLAGDPAVVKELLAVRKHLGLIVPAPVQNAMIAALGDQAHVDEQRERYARRRAALRTAFEGAGFRIEHSEASLYLWATRGEPCWDTVGDLAEHGILVAPGEFYGPGGREFVRIAFTATDERVAAAVARLG